MLHLRSWLATGLVLIGAAPAARAEEGLWTLDQAARSGVARRIGLKDDEGLRKRLRSNVVRFSSGESGALVSSRGLVVTVRSAAVPCLSAASRSGADHVRDGFWGGDGEDLKCPDLYVEQLVSSKDVTERLRLGLARADEIPPDRIVSLEKQCRTESGLECRVTPLFDGGVMLLEQFRRFGDVRLVFAPDHRVAAFGTSSARMTFPRYSLDVAFLRIYEQGNPLQSDPALPWQAAGPAINDHVVVASYPGETERYLPWVFLEPLVSSVYRIESEMARGQAQALLELSRKQTETAVQEEVRAGLDRLAAELRSAMAVLQNRPVKRKQRAAESDWRGLFAAPDSKDAKAAWAAASAAQAQYEKFYQRYLLVEGDRVPPFGRLFDIGRQLVRWTEEKKESESDRLAGYRGHGMADIERQLSAPIPFSGAAEEALIEHGLLRLRDQLGPKDPLVLALAAESPADRAAKIVVGTMLANEAVRKKILATGDLGEVADDPLVTFVRTVESEARPLRQKYEREVQHNLSAYLRAVGERVSAADTAVTPRYSNASLDLRLSSGQVSGFLGFGRDVPAQTTMGGLITRAVRAQPGSLWELPARWRERLRQVDLAKPLNFAIDADVGSGAPGGVVLNQNGELIGVVIDSTLKSAVNRFLYRGGDERAVAVHPAGIVEALRRVYGAGKLADELMVGAGK
jgi:hypothetical protein